jgi:predicted regulator of Ras-like GTPase activity (Roadblock/LC7/MglB family)
MPSSNLVLYEDDLGEIQTNLEVLAEQSNAKFVFLIDKNGQQLAFVGATDGLDSTSLASLAASNVAATEGLAQLIGEPFFTSLFHEGNRDNLHITVVGGRAILVLAFDEHSSLGLVRLRVTQASDMLVKTMENIERRSQERKAQEDISQSPFAEITDEDIDNLFSD